MGLPRLVVTSLKETYTFHAQSNSVKIGRSLKCDFNIPREDLSREHCLFEIIGDELFITDLESKNGMSVDGLKLLPMIKTKVTFDSEIILSNAYQLHINAPDIHTKSEIVYKLPKADLQTVTYELDRREMSPHATRTRKLVQEEPQKNETLKMILGFLTVLGSIAYLISLNF